MHWPPDHPILTDAPLRARMGGVAEVLTDWRLGSVLRHVAGRRIAVRVETADGPGVLKVFASPRARGAARRLRLLLGSHAAAVVPAIRGVDRAGHVLVTGWVGGVPLHELDGDRFVDACHGAGGALRRLHGSGARLDRTWTCHDEVAHLRRTLPQSLAHLLPLAMRVAAPLATSPLVSAHRDFHLKQAVAAPGGVRLIDLDDAAQAPAALDVGNFLAHLRADQALGTRSAAATGAARRAFLTGYGERCEHDERWEWLALLRLAGLAVTRESGREAAHALARATEEMAA